MERLKGELATAEEAEALRSKDETLTDKLARINLTDAFQSADPQSEALARLTGFTSSTVKDSLAILVALLIELGSGFGLWVATASGGVTAAAQQAKATPEAQQRLVEETAATPQPRKPAEPTRSGAQRRKKKPRTDPVKAFLKSCGSSRLSDEATAAELHAAFNVTSTLQKRSVAA